MILRPPDLALTVKGAAMVPSLREHSAKSGSPTDGYENKKHPEKSSTAETMFAI